MPFQTIHSWFSERPARKKYCGAALGLWFFICLFLTPVYTTVTLEFASDPSGEAITTVFTSFRENVTARGAKCRVINNGTARISFLDIQYGSHSSLKRIDPVDENWKGDEPLTISSIAISKNGFQVLELEGSELSAAFTGNDQVQLQSSGEGLTFQILGNDPQLIPTEPFSLAYAKSGRLLSVCTSFVLGGLLLTLFTALTLWLAEQILNSEDRFLQITYWIFYAGLLGAVFLCFYVGMRSPFWLNPDEYDTKAAVLYYFTHWMPPDIRSEIINDSYPVYGTSRHFEFNTFYFWAGKLGQLFSDAALQIRAFSLLIFGAMAALILKSSKKHFALFCVLLMTPQVWYIFSYSTSDALDFFVGFLCLYELIREESLLNRLLEKPFRKKQIPGYLIVAFLFVNVFFSKASFYPILIFLFLILLIRLFDREKGPERKCLFRKYLALAGLTLAMFAVRYLITDFPYYGFDKLNVVIEVTEQHAEYGYKPSTPPLEQAPSMSFYGKGITLREFFRDYEFNKNLFRTVAGFFGCYDFGAGDWYYLVMGALYLAFFGCLIYEFIRMRQKKKWLEFGAVSLTVLIQYALVVFNAYVIDFQPQGRYMLPVLLYTAYLVHTCEPAGKNRGIRLILCATCLLSLYAFFCIGVPNLVPQNTGHLG